MGILTRRAARTACATLCLAAAPLAGAAGAFAGHHEATPAAAIAAAARPGGAPLAAALMVVEPAGSAIRLNVVQQLGGVIDRPAGDEPLRLVFPLPVLVPAAREVAPVEFVSGWRSPKVVNGVIVDALPRASREAELAYAFFVRPRDGAATLRWTLPYGAAGVEVLVTERGVRVSAPDLRDRGIVTERGRRYRHWSAGPVNAGGVIGLRLDAPSSSGDRGPEMIAAVLAVALLGGLVVTLRRRPGSVERVPPCLL